MKEHWIVWGAGGHGRVVLDLLRCLDIPDTNIAFVDDRLQGIHAGVRVHHPKLVKNLRVSRYIVAIGDNAARQKVYNKLLTTHHLPGILIHPKASVAPSAKIGDGTVVCAQANVGAGATVEEGCIINTGANVDHDCRVGWFSHIAPHANLCGAANIGGYVLIGAGAVLLPGASVGIGATVGAGATVLCDRNVPKGCTVIGTPAKELTNTQ